MNLSTDQIRTVDQMRAFVDGAELAEIGHVDRDGAYTLIARTLERFFEKATGLSRAQVTRLVGRRRRTGGLHDHGEKRPAPPLIRAP